MAFLIIWQISKNKDENTKHYEILKKEEERGPESSFWVLSSSRDFYLGELQMDIWLMDKSDFSYKKCISSQNALIAQIGLIHNKMLSLT